MNRWFINIGFLIILSIVSVTSHAQPTGMSSFYGNSTYAEHLFFGDGNGDIHEFFLDSGGWHDYDLTVISNGTTTSGPLTSFYTGGTFPEHVFFSDKSFNVHELWSDNNGGWHDSNLTSMAHGVAAAQNTALTAFYSGGSNPEHVFFIDTAAHLHEMYSDTAGAWHDRDLTTTVIVTTTGQPMPFYDSGLTSFYVSGSSSPEHLFFLDNNFHVRELYSDSNGWNYRDLTALSNGAVANTFSFLSSFYRDATYPEHVFFPDVAGDVHELWSDSSGGWHDSDITALANGPTANGSAIVSFYSEGSTPEHVFYFDYSFNVHELFSDSNGWHDSNIAAMANAPHADYKGYLTAFYEGGGYPEHAFFVQYGPGPNGPEDYSINELWSDSGNNWHDSVVPW
jgi:hypothetical protein